MVFLLQDYRTETRLRFNFPFECIGEKYRLPEVRHEMGKGLANYCVTTDTAN